MLDKEGRSIFQNADAKKASLGERRSRTMLWTIVVILVVLWLLGLVANIGGGLIHALLVIAVIIMVVNLLQGRRALR
jgi:uncharacterized membrane protein